MTLKGKTAIVTGGSRGIGRAIVRRLAADGARVIFSYRRDREAAHELAAEVEQSVPVQADQADLSSLDALFAEAGDGLDILVNNAGMVGRTLIADLTAEETERMFTVNVTYPLFAIQRAIPLLRDDGRIVNISTLNTVLPALGLALYCSSKAALEQVSAVAARELGPRGITVNSVSPGTTDTEMFRDANGPGAEEQVVPLTALGRIGRPDDIAAVVAFLAGPDGRWVTGQNIRATGGLLV